MKRRLFVSAVAAPFAHVTFQDAIQVQAALAATGPVTPPPTTAAERQPFIAIAKAKGATIAFNSIKAQSNAQGVHLDMNMVQASINNAAARAKAAGYQSIAAKLQRLGAVGTAAQKTDFVMGSGKYYFPEDIEKAGAQSGVHAMGIVCHTFWYLVCRCHGNNDQDCHDAARTVCGEEG